MNRQRLKQLAQKDVNDMCKRYKSECIDYPVRLETEEEKRERLLRNRAKELYNKRYKLGYKENKK